MNRYENWEENEQWVDLKDYPSHQVSTYGRVRNKKNGHVLKPSVDRYGYEKISIGNHDNIPVHRLVCETFYNLPRGENNQVNHIDCDRRNNHILNLEWCTRSDNIKWGISHGEIDPMKGLSKAIEVNKKRVRIVELNKIFSSVLECAEFLGVPATNVSRCLVGCRKGQRLHGYHLEFVDGGDYAYE